MVAVAAEKGINDVCHRRNGRREFTRHHGKGEVGAVQPVQRVPPTIALRCASAVGADTRGQRLHRRRVECRV
jgi:hypothetical protein